MSKQADRQTEELPEIPDYPDSPLSAWKHYGILRALESRFHEELRDYKGHLVGLDVTYTVDDIPYTMKFGYGFEKAELLENQEDPLSDDFVAEMYDLAMDLIAKHIYPEDTKFGLELSASTNQQVNTKTAKCDIANANNCGTAGCNGQCRKFIKRNDGTWQCTHRTGRCRC